MTKFFSHEIQRQYNLIKILLSDFKKYKEALEEIKKILHICQKDSRES